MNDQLTIRHSNEHDSPALLRLAALDGQAQPSGGALLAFAGGELRAALPDDGGPAIADPFYPSAVLVELLALRHAHEHGEADRRRSRGVPALLRPLAA